MQAIARGRFQTQQRDKGKQLRINDQIRISPIRLIDENNEQVGIIEVDDAKRRARAAGLDLVEVSSASRPPVCRIMDYGKWKYQQKKKEQKARSHSKHSELKEVRLRPKIDDHDLLIKTEKARQFLEEGNKVQFTMQFRGREMAHKNLGYNTLIQISETLADLSRVEINPRMAAGRRMTMVLVPDQRTTKPVPPKPAAKTPAPSTPQPPRSPNTSGTTQPQPVHPPSSATPPAARAGAANDPPTETAASPNPASDPAARQTPVG